MGEGEEEGEEEEGDKEDTSVNDEEDEAGVTGRNADEEIGGLFVYWRPGQVYEIRKGAREVQVSQGG